jgi:geranylgeranyl pyrophosphate synthase
LKELSFLSLVRDDLEHVEALLRERPAGQHRLIGMAVDHLVSGRGKRIRPALVLLSARLCGAEMDRVAFAAAAVEMLHTATLIHDDLIDGALMRRGIETLNANWSPAATVLTGDYIFARAAYLASQADNVRLMQRFSETLMVICNGEVRQMFDGRGDQVSRQEYERRIYAKTASLIAMSAEAGAILADAGGGTMQALRSYGEQLGLAFQVVDDVLDFVAERETLGKPVGSDLRQGLVTLPVLLFLEEEPDHPAVCRALRGNSPEEVVREAVRAVTGSVAVERSLEVARRHAERANEALNGLPDSSYRTALLELADFTVRRRF